MTVVVTAKVTKAIVFPVCPENCSSGAEVKYLAPMIADPTHRTTTMMISPKITLFDLLANFDSSRDSDTTGLIESIATGNRPVSGRKPASIFYPAYAAIQSFSMTVSRSSLISIKPYC